MTDDVTPLGPRPTYPIESVDNALKLLGMFRKRQLIRVSDASAELGIARSTAHRLLAMLQYHGFVRQDPLTRAYLVGRGLLDLGLSALRGLEARTVARPELERLCREVDETVTLTVLDGRSALTVDSVEGSRSLRVGSRTGIAVPAHSTAAGKALLAALAPEDVEALFADVRLEAATARTIARFDDLERELERVRSRGYATSFEEREAGVASVAAAIDPRALGQLAAIGIDAPSARMGRLETVELGKAVAASAEAIAARVRLEQRSA
jgi:IclR family transcriptional regulator, acetate operon repressor